MKKWIYLLLASVFHAGSAELPRFESYLVTNVFRGTPALVDLKSHPRAWEYRTRLREGSKEKPNFAGSYTLVTWGCGSPCQEVALIDARNGRVYFAPFVTSLGGRFRQNSRLFVVDAPEDIAEYYGATPPAEGRLFYTEYWLWEEETKRFKLLATENSKPRSQSRRPTRKNAFEHRLSVEGSAGFALGTTQLRADEIPSSSVVCLGDGIGRAPDAIVGQDPAGPCQRHPRLVEAPDQHGRMEGTNVSQCIGGLFVHLPAPVTFNMSQFALKDFHLAAIHDFIRGLPEPPSSTRPAS